MLPTFFYTRLGIGVSDRDWWEYRLRLFSAVTLPSISRQLTGGPTWLIFIDSYMDRNLRARLDGLISDVANSVSIQLIEIDVVSQIQYRLAQITATQDRVRLVRIDDDDALDADFLLSIPEVDGIYTWPLGYEAAIAERILRPTIRPFLSLNTVYVGPSELVEEYASIGHHRQVEWAEKRGLQAMEVQSDSKMFMYSRHKQSDSSFGSIRNTIKDDPNNTPLSLWIRQRFGINEELFEEWRVHARSAPSAPSASTWNLSKELNQEAVNLARKLDSIHKDIRASTNNIFAETR